MLLVVHRGLELLIVRWGKTPVAQGVEHMRPMLRATHALARSAIGTATRISLHAHQHRVACPYAALIHLLNVAAVVRGVLRGDRPAQLR